MAFVTSALSWGINILVLIGWLVNIKHHKEAMFIFTVTTLLSIAYFAITQQVPFLLRALIYLIIDVVTIRHIKREETNE